MVRFNDKPLITTLSDDDIMPITDMSEPSSDKKMNMKQLSEYVANLASHDVASAFKTLGTETVSSDSSAYKEILDRKHSTFDRSKFTVVGNPTITDDGIASGFSSANYLIKSNIDFTSANSWKITTPIHYITNNTSNGVYQIFNGGYSNDLYINASGYVKFNIRAGISGATNLSFSSQVNATGYNAITLVNGNDYIHTLEFTGTQYIFNLYKDGSLIYSDIKNSTDKIYPSSSNGINIGTSSYDGSMSTGSIDLKQFSIEVDGIEVFNGNKTGIDQIKKDDYTIVGSPTITEDGIASGFSSANYLSTNNFSFGSSSWEIISSFIFTGTATGNRTVYAGKSANASAPMLYVQNNQFSCYIPDSIGNWGYTKIGISQTFTMNTKYWIKLGYNNVNSHYYAKVSTDGINYTTKFDELSSVILLQGTGSFDFSIGYNEGYHANPFDVGSIDLNSFKIYVDGNLVYQPTLRIPYTESKTGSKIVNAYARDRVFDLYEQTGKALYYTIDEENKNFTAPLSDIYGMITDNASLKNFTPEGKERFEAQNSYLTGDILKEEQGLNQVKMMKHSTFDRNKFTIIGSPTITDDGVASGFSGSNYLTIPSQNLTYQNDWEFVSPSFTVGQNNISQSVSMIGVADTGRLAVATLNNAKLLIALQKRNGETTTNIIRSDDITYSLNTKYQAKITHTKSGIYSIYLKTDDRDFELVKTITDTLIQFNTSNSVARIGYQTDNANPFINGSIDLKQFSITVDGIEVFSGNKTGIDQIKADNFTKVGNPTITDEGILSNLTNNNYINSTAINLGSKWDIYFEHTTPNTFGSTYWLLGNTAGEAAPYLRMTSSGKLQRGYGSGNAWWANGDNCNITYNTNTSYLFHYYFENNVRYGLEYSMDNGNTWKTDFQVVVGNPTPAIRNYTLGSFGTTFNSSLGSFDINKFKIYVNDQLVYQSCLKIPYTLSKTGSKIANYGYRDRVQDMYEQFGYAPYYTLENDSFTLPKGEIYGLIGSRSLKSHFRSGINYYDLYSDRELEQGGACTSGVAVNLLKPYEDANYVLSVPYSAKTAIGFTPTSTGTWMAKGIAKSLD